MGSAKIAKICKYWTFIFERGLAAARDGSGRMGGLAAADMGGQLQPFY